MTENTHSSGRESAPDTSVFSGLGGRLLVLAIVSALFLSIVSMPAAAQSSSSGIDVCGEITSDGDGTDLASQIQAVLTVIVLGGILGGVTAIIIGYASKSVPFLDSSTYSDFPKKGFVYGLGLPIFLYLLSFLAGFLGINVDCIIPFV